MKKFYLTGHNNFGNRGCEALARATVQMLRDKFGKIKVYVPSLDIARDKHHWPEHEDYGVEFVDVYLPWQYRYWSRIQNLPIPFIKRILWAMPFQAWHSKLLQEIDAVISIGGDNYSLNYSFPGLLIGENELAMRSGKPVILWAASVGPFEAQADFIPLIKKHLSKMSLITVRETISLEYLNNLEIKNVVLVTDPAFLLEEQETDTKDFWPKGSRNGVVGLNLSPLIANYRPISETKEAMPREVANFMRKIVEEKGYSVILIPHVVPLNGDCKNNDEYYMRSKILSLTGDLDGRVGIVPNDIDACRLKYIIGKCDYFIGARTHSTIAALSSCVPTISIAYSIKAKGLNKDLFGHMDYVLDTPDISEKSLIQYFEKLVDDKDEVKATLMEKIPIWKENAKKSVELLAEIL